MAASLVRRGIANIRIPTTLVGQVDAAVGIKGAVNLSGKKSAVGCYYPPETVLVDPLFLKTLPSCQLQNGFAEIAKIAITSDESLFCLMERCGPKVIREGFLPHDNHHRQIVWTAAVRMLEQLQPNLYEDQTFRRLVGFGHTFSPALESASGFSLQHGQAVAIDMALSAVLAFELGMMDANRRDRILDLLLCIGLPVHSPLLTTILCESALQEAKLHRGGHVNLVLPTGLSDMVFMESLESLLAPLANSLRWLERNSGKRMSSLQHVRHETSGMQNGIPLRI